jgi:acyl-CoA synthetase (NDP forming)
VDILSEGAARARSEGRSTLVETEVFPALESLGWDVPQGVTVDDGDGTPDLGRFSGDSIVVKLLSHRLPHRSDIDGVRVVPRDTKLVERALSELRASSPDPEARLLLQEFISHDVEPGGELLLGARWTEEFGPVVTLRFGGVRAEAMAALEGPSSLRPVISPRFPGDVEELVASPVGQRATQGDRGRAPRIARRDLVRTVEAFAHLADAVMPGAVTELEVNPLVFRNDRPVALDALAIVAEDILRRREVKGLSDARLRGIRSVLAPESVAIVGVARRTNPGRVILRNLLAAGFPDDAIRVVKPDADQVDGCACVPDLAALSPGVDQIILSVGAKDVPGLMTEVVAGKLARSVVLIPGGLGEGGENAHRGAEVRATLNSAGDDAPVVNGGNCLGVRSLPGRCNTLFIPPEKLAFPDVPPHPVAMISQSGAFAIARASGIPWLNPRTILTVGNQLDLTVGEYLEALAEDQNHRVFACYVEGFQELDGLRFLRAARCLRDQGRAVILYRAGRTPAGADAAASHTASLAGDYVVTRSLATAAGVLLAESLDDFEDLLTASVLLDGRAVGGTRLGAVSNAGFECVALADAMGTMDRAALAPSTASRLNDILSGHRLDGIVSAQNPLDVTPILGDDAFVDSARAVLEDPGVDVGVVGCVPLTPALRTLEGESPGLGDADGVLPGLLALWADSDKAWAVVVDGGPPYDPFAREMASGGIPTFRRSDRALRAMARYVAWRLT